MVMVKNQTVAEGSMNNIKNNFEFILNRNKQILFVFPKGVDTKDNTNLAGQFPYDIIDPKYPNKIEAADIIVYPEFRRLGLATAMYEKMVELGFQVFRSSHQTDAGKRMWAGFAQAGREKNGEFRVNTEYDNQQGVAEGVYQ